MEIKEYITDYDQLFDSMLKCKKNVSWKPSVKSFVLNGVENCLKMEEQLQNDKWINKKPKPIVVTYPKRRECLSIPFRDRVYQRSINDNSLYPQTTKHFVYTNIACQKFKGTKKAMDVMRQYLHRYYINNKTNVGYVVWIDIHGYYQNMRHKDVNECFYKMCDSDTASMSKDVLDTQYSGDIGYNPGSQMVQIAGISLLNELDHFIKEKLHCKSFIRYMDDSYLITNDKEKAKQWKKIVCDKLIELGFEPNPKKAKVLRIDKGFMFLGFKATLSKTGKVYYNLSSENIKHERRKLKKQVIKAKKGEMTKMEGDKSMIIKQLDVSIEKQAQEEYQASQVQSTKDELENQKFLTEYVACMAGIELPFDEEETEEMTHVQDFE